MSIENQNFLICALLDSIQLFFIPSFSSIEATAPLGLLAISTPLLRAGYQVTIIDSTISPDYKQHNPNVASGRDAMVAFMRQTRPVRPIQPEITS